MWKRKRRAPEPEMSPKEQADADSANMPASAGGVIRRCFCGSPVREGFPRCARHVGTAFYDLETRGGAV